MTSVPVALAGPMGVGKSTVGPLLAEALGVPHFDTDAIVESKLDATVADLDAGASADQPLVDAAIRRIIGQTYLTMHRTDDAVTQLETAVRLFGDHVSTASAWAHSSLGVGYKRQGRLEAAETVQREAVRRMERLPEHPDLSRPDFYQHLATTLTELSRFEDASPIARQAYEARLDELGPDHIMVCASLRQLARIEAERKAAEEKSNETIGQVPIKEEVRRIASTNLNATTQVMKEWLSVRPQ